MKKYFWILIVIVIVIDQLSKFVTGKMGMTMILNTGVSWGLVNNWDNRLLTFLIGICLIGLCFYLKNVFGRELIWWSFIIGGGLSNLIDRIYVGGVKDWIVVFIWFPWFNLADVFVSLGVMGLMVKYLLNRKDQVNGFNEFN